MSNHAVQQTITVVALVIVKKINLTLAHPFPQMCIRLGVSKLFNTEAAPINIGLLLATPLCKMSLQNPLIILWQMFKKKRRVVVNPYVCCIKLVSSTWSVFSGLFCSWAFFSLAVGQLIRAFPFKNIMIIMLFFLLLFLTFSLIFSSLLLFASWQPLNMPVLCIPVGLRGWGVFLDNYGAPKLWIFKFYTFWP